MNLKGKTVLVTGASRGLGRAVALELSKRGAKVVAVSRSAVELGELVAEIQGRGGEGYGIVADVGDPQAIHPLAAQAQALAGPLSVLINNASTLGPVPLRGLLDTDCEDFERALSVNLLGPFRLSKLILGGMLVRGEGMVVNISSDAAVSAYPEWGAYSVTKAALDHLTRIWAAELEPLGESLRLLSFDPGEMDTRMHADAVPGADRSRLGRPEDSARSLVGIIERGTGDAGQRVVFNGLN